MKLISISSVDVAFDADAVVMLIIKPDNGMTAASTPAAGNQAIIHINSSFRISFILIQIRLAPIGSTVTGPFKPRQPVSEAVSSLNHRYPTVGSRRAYLQPSCSRKVKRIFEKPNSSTGEAFGPKMLRTPRQMAIREFLLNVKPRLLPLAGKRQNLSNSAVCN